MFFGLRLCLQFTWCSTASSARAMNIRVGVEVSLWPPLTPSLGCEGHTKPTKLRVSQLMIDDTIQVDLKSLKSAIGQQRFTRLHSFLDYSIVRISDWFVWSGESMIKDPYWPYCHCPENMASKGMQTQMLQCPGIQICEIWPQQADSVGGWSEISEFVPNCGI